MEKSTSVLNSQQEKKYILVYKTQISFALNLRILEYKLTRSEPVSCGVLKSYLGVIKKV